MSNNNFRADLVNEAWMTTGALYAAILDANHNLTTPYLPIGDVEAVDMSYEVQKADKYSVINGPRTKTRSVTTQRDGNISITGSSFHGDNLAKLTYGINTKVESKASYTETIVANPGYISPLQYVIDTITSVKEGTTTTLEEGKNYEVNKGSLFFYPSDEQTSKGATNVVEKGDVLSVVYSTKDSEVIETFMQDSVLVSLYFEGTNIGNNADQVQKVWIHAVELNPATLSLLSIEDFGSFTLDGTMLASKRIQGSGVSKFAKIVKSE